MLKRLRRMKISLAAKIQLFFGVAVVLIIAAALFVPWLRMQGLMDSFNRTAAQSVADICVTAHQTRPTTPSLQPAIGPPITAPATTAPAYAAPRLISIEPGKSVVLTRFESRALRALSHSPELEFYSETHLAKDGQERYEFAAPLYAEGDCLRCHATAAETSPASAALTPIPTTHPTTGPSAPETHGRLLGIVSVNIPSKVDANQVFLNGVLILIAGLLAGALAIGIFYGITTRLILRPVRVLQATAEKVSRGDLNIRSHIATGDEFQQLSETINVMLANLKLSADQLRSINKSLDLKLGQLSESNLALYESNRLKSEFLANVSHELRTPLNSILGFAELLKETAGAGPDAKSSRYIQNILSSGRNLLDLINDLLDLAKIEAGRMEVRSEPLSLNDLFEGLTSILKPLCEGKSLTIEVSVAADVPIVRTDPAKLQQVLYNFLSNAIEFSPTGGVVELNAARQGEQGVKISVTDHGPGIEPDKQDLIFEKFRQIDGSVTRQHRGAGLGLAISKELTDLLGGTIGVSSIPGQGATFWILIPFEVEPGLRDVRSKKMVVG
jgi:two-component system, NarL family, sensor histidine kinase BarA